MNRTIKSSPFRWTKRGLLLATILIPLGFAQSAYPCSSSEDCDDGLFCNGSENCLNEACVDGPLPCSDGQTCNEEADFCQGTGPSPGHLLVVVDGPDGQCVTEDPIAQMSFGCEAGHSK